MIFSCLGFRNPKKEENNQLFQDSALIRKKDIFSQLSKNQQQDCSEM